MVAMAQIDAVLAVWMVSKTIRLDQHMRATSLSYMGGNNQSYPLFPFIYLRI
jgi:hypothetical protein